MILVKLLFMFGCLPHVAGEFQPKKRKCSLTVELALIGSCTYDMAMFLSS